MLMEELVEDAIANGGGTYTVSMNNRGTVFAERADNTWGYYVSRKNGVENFPYIDSDVLSNVIKHVIEDEGENPFYSYFGVWQDENGNWSFDVTMWVATYDIAWHAARAENQRAIFSIATSESIAVTQDA